MSPSDRLVNIYLAIEVIRRDITNNPDLTDQDILYYQEKMDTLRRLVKDYSEEAEKGDYLVEDKT